jgi:hypothetical protein
LAIVVADAIQFDAASGPADDQAYFADVVVRGTDGALVALVDVRNPIGLTAEVATGTRRNLIANGLVNLQAPFFLMVSQDQGYVWKQQPNEPPDSPPLATCQTRDGADCGWRMPWRIGSTISPRRGRRNYLRSKLRLGKPVFWTR